MKNALVVVALTLAPIAVATADRYGPKTQTTRTTAAFGSETDVQFAKRLWREMSSIRLAGSNRIHTVPYAGAHPHGAVLETFRAVLKIDGHKGELIVKRNYGGTDVAVETVTADPDRHLEAVTVMYRRPGYDPANQNWFWAKYAADGSLERNEKGVYLAGRVAKGSTAGCIACHKTAPGNDYLFKFDR